MRVLIRDQIDDFMRSPEIDPLFKARLWKELPLEQRQMSYDALRPYFERLCAELDPPWSLAAAFGEPAGMEIFRAEAVETRGAPRPEGVETGARYKD